MKNHENEYIGTPDWIMAMSSEELQLEINKYKEEMKRNPSPTRVFPPNKRGVKLCL